MYFSRLKTWTILGVCLLGIVFSLPNLMPAPARFVPWRAIHLGLDLPAAREFQIKFKAMILPGDAVILALRHDAAKGRLGFEYRRGDTVCSIGTVFLR